MLVNEPCIANNAEGVLGGLDVFLHEFDALLAISIAGLLSTLAWTKQDSCPQPKLLTASKASAAKSACHLDHSRHTRTCISSSRQSRTEPEGDHWEPHWHFSFLLKSLAEQVVMKSIVINYRTSVLQNRPACMRRGIVHCSDFECCRSECIYLSLQWEDKVIYPYYTTRLLYVTSKLITLPNRVAWCRLLSVERRRSRWVRRLNRWSTKSGLILAAYSNFANHRARSCNHTMCRISQPILI